MRKPDTRKGDRHRPGYWKEYGRIRRARDKERLAELKARAGENWAEAIVSVEKALQNAIARAPSPQKEVEDEQQ